jgi:hypothetical protein
MDWSHWSRSKTRPSGNVKRHTYVIVLAMLETSTFSHTSMYFYFSKKSKYGTSQISPISTDGSKCGRAKEDKCDCYFGHCPLSRFKQKVPETASVCTIQCKGEQVPGHQEQLVWWQAQLSGNLSSLKTGPVSETLCLKKLKMTDDAHSMSRSLYHSHEHPDMQKGC